MKLKPCPFCKMGDLRFVQVPVVIIEPSGRRTHRTDHALACSSCDALGPPAFEKEVAASMWNLRGTAK